MKRLLKSTPDELLRMHNQKRKEERKARALQGGALPGQDEMVSDGHGGLAHRRVEVNLRCH